MADCSSIQKSLAWCQGRPELPGVKRRIYYISKYDIVKWPTLQHDANGRLASAAYSGDFTLLADSKWKYIDIIADKSQLTSEAQGEYPSQTHAWRARSQRNQRRSHILRRNLSGEADKC